MELRSAKVPLECSVFTWRWIRYLRCFKSLWTISFARQQTLRSGCFAPVRCHVSHVPHSFPDDRNSLKHSRSFHLATNRRSDRKLFDNIPEKIWNQQIFLKAIFYSNFRARWPNWTHFTWWFPSLSVAVTHSCCPLELLAMRWFSPLERCDLENWYAFY